MKALKKYLSLLILLLVFCALCTEAFAIRSAQDGIAVELTTGKSSYGKDESISITMTVTNTGTAPVSDVKAEIIIPVGYRFKGSTDCVRAVDRLDGGETLRIETECIKDLTVLPTPSPTVCPEPTPTPAPTSKPNYVFTGDESDIALWVTLATVSVVAIALLAVRFKPWRHLFTLLLCLFIVGAIAVPAYGASDMTQKSINISVPVSVDGSNITIEGKVTYTFTPPAQTYDVSYDLNYEGAPAPVIQQIEQGEHAAEPTAPTRDGYIFMGWCPDSLCSRKFDFNNKISGDTTVYAKWGKLENVSSFQPQNADRYIDDGLYADVSGEEHIQFDATSGLEFFDNELILYGFDGVSDSDIATLIAEDQGVIVGRDVYVNSFLVRFAVPKELNELDALMDKYKGSGLVDEAFINLATETTTNYYPQTSEWPWKNSLHEGNWGMEAINAPEAWDYREYMSPVIVGVYDRGFDISHTDLTDVIEESWLSEKTNLNHGTHVAGIIGASFNDGSGICGVCPTAHFYLIDEQRATNVASETLNKNKAYCSSYNWYIALSKLIQSGCKVVNISMGFSEVLAKGASEGNAAALNELNAYKDATTTLLRDLVKINPNFTICNSAGNSRRTVFYKDASAKYGYYKKCMDESHKHDGDYYIDNKGKCRKCSDYMLKNAEIGGVDAYHNYMLSLVDDYELMKRIIVVGACCPILGDEEDKVVSYSLAYMSNDGERVDVIAPGMYIYSTMPNERYGNADGTSEASPHVAGLAAMLYAIDPDISAERVKEIIVSTATTEVADTDKMMINAEAAVEKLIESKCIVSATITNGTDPIPTASVTFDCMMGTIGDSWDESITANTDENGELKFKIPDGVISINKITFKADGYEDYVYPDTIDVHTSNDLGKIVMELELFRYYAMSYVKNGNTNQPVANAEVLLSATAQEYNEYTKTDEKGYFRLGVLSPGEYILIITADGYSDITRTFNLTADCWIGDASFGEGEDAYTELYMTPTGEFTGFAGGDGTEDNPYQIATAVQMNAVRDYPSSHFILVNDIDLGVYDYWVPIGTNEVPFTGSLNGQGHSISNLTISDASMEAWLNEHSEKPNFVELGLFGSSHGASFSNIVLSDVYTELELEYESINWLHYGSLCGGITLLQEDYITKCSVSGNISLSGSNIATSHVGALLGTAGPYGTIDQCISYADISVDGGGGACGGICGSSTNELSNCKNYGNIIYINNVGPDILCGGIVGYTTHSIYNCINNGNISTETKDWGWPTSANYRHQTGGIVGLFRGDYNSNSPEKISACNNYGDIEIISFTGFYYDSYYHCDNDYTGGICGGFECLSSSYSYGIISDCNNYGNISATATEDYGGELRAIASPRVGRIGGLSFSGYTYANNFSDANVLLNGNICTENIGADTQNGANIGEDEQPIESATVIKSHVLDGVSNMPIAEAMVTVYDNIDSSASSSITMTTTNETGYFEAALPADGYYYYSITVDGYEDKFGEAEIVGATWVGDSFTEWTTEAETEVVAGTILLTRQAQEETEGYTDYAAFLADEAYYEYTLEWYSAPDAYAFIDINQDSVDELIIYSENDGGFMNTVIFTKNDSGIIVSVDNFYHYGYLRYDAETCSVAYSELNPTEDTGSVGFYVLESESLNCIYVVGQDNYVYEGYCFIYYPDTDETVVLSPEEKSGYYQRLEYIMPIPLNG